MFITKLINVELTILLVYFVNTFTDAIYTNLIIYRTCYIVLNFNVTLCDKLTLKIADNSSDILEKTVQPYANDIVMCSTFVQTVASAFVCTILGPWSDKNGRKPIIIGAIAGLLLSYVIKAIVSYFTYISPWLLILHTLPIILTGGLPSLYTAALCLVIDTTDKSTRGIKMSLYEAFSLIGMLVGSFMSGYAFNATNYVIIFGICATITLINLIYVIVFIKESVIINETDSSERFINLKYTLSVFTVIFKKRKFDKRFTLYINFIALSLFIISNMSPLGIQFMYFRLTFHWDLNEYTIFIGIISATWTFGNLSVVWLFHKLLHYSEISILLLGLTSAIFYYCVMGFATKLWHIVIALLLRVSSGAVIPMARTLISTITPSEESGKIFSFTVILENVSNVIGIPLYVYLYDLLITVFPGIIYILSAIINLISCILILILFCKKKTDDIN